MLTSELQHTIDERWDACWPINKLRPIVILDLVSYLFFIKEISSAPQPIQEPVNHQGLFWQDAKERETIKSNFFNDLDYRNIYSLFAGENGIAGLGKEYLEHAEYGSFFKDGLLMSPTPKLLENALGIIKIIEEARHDIKGSIFTYLLGKAAMTDSNGHAYLPGYLAELLVGIVRPCENDLILDPSLADGSLLVGCAKYIGNGSLKLLSGNVFDFDSHKLKGMESDMTSLRIAAMNLMLHGINNASLKALDIFSPLNSITSEDATVIIANLIFLPGENNRNVEANTGRDIIRKEIYYLDFILRNLINGSRCAVIVPDIILYQVATEFVTMRRKLIENYKLDAIISIEERKSPLFNGAAILVFSKEISSVTDKVWFYKLKHSDTAPEPALNISKQSDDIINVLEHYRNKEKIQENGEGFYITADGIKAKNYNFSYNEYSPFVKTTYSNVHTITIKSTDLPKWEPKRVNEATSLLQPMLKVSSELTADKAKDKSPDRLKIFDHIRKSFPSKARYRLIIDNAKTKSLDWWKSIEHTRKTFLSKKIISKKNLLRAVFFILLFVIGYFFYSFLFLQKDAFVKDKKQAETGAIGDSVKGNLKLIASSLHSADSVVNTTNNDLLNDSKSNNKTSFKVISKAYFYSSPALNSPENTYITNMDNDLLTPVKEENGFVYVDYINGQGKSLKGWLNINDLEATSFPAFEGDTDKKVSPVLPENENRKTKYLVNNKAYFYLKPDTGTRIDLYLAKPNHTQLLPLKEENGFVYVVYVNTKGKSTRGWLSKKDLVAVQNN